MSASYNKHNKLNLKVIARPGPYVCGELDFGGFPARLRKIMNVVRTNSSEYINEVDAFWGKLLPTLTKWLYNVPNSDSAYTNEYREPNAPIIMVQLENEFAYFGD